MGDRQPCQLKVETQVGFFPPKDRQTIREIEGGTAWEKRTSDIGPCGFVVCLSCSDRRGVDLECVEGTIKDDISLKGVLYGATGRLLSSATGCVFSLTCTSPCMSSPLRSEPFGSKWQDDSVHSFYLRQPSLRLFV